MEKQAGEVHDSPMTARSLTVESVVPTGPDCIRVFLCDDIPELRALMAFSLEDDERLVVVGEAGDGHGCVRGVSETQADVVLLDLSMPDCDGLHAIPLLRQQAPACAIVVLSGLDAARMAPQVMAAGASAFLEKGESFSRIRDAVLAAAGAQSVRAA